MGYNRNNLKRIKEEYATKHLVAEKESDVRRRELHERLPDLAAIDRKLSGVGVELMGVALSAGGDKEARFAALRQETEELNRKRDALLVAAGYPADYTDVKYECEKCSDSGYVGIKMCDCMRNALIMAGYESSGIAQLLKTQTFENFSLDYYKAQPESYAMMEKIFAYVKNYAENFESGRSENIAMFGGTGLGKTHISSAIAKKVIEKGNDVFYVTAVDMVSDFEAEQFGGQHMAKGELTDRYFDCDLLIIDDLGAEMANQFTVSCLYNLLNVRINRRAATVLSTNLTQQELFKKYNERITSRVIGEFRILPFTGADIRMQKIKAGKTPVAKARQP